MVRVLDDNGETRQGLVPSVVLKTSDEEERIRKIGGPAADAAFRRQWVYFRLIYLWQIINMQNSTRYFVYKIKQRGEKVGCQLSYGAYRSVWSDSFPNLN